MGSFGLWSSVFFTICVICGVGGLELVDATRVDTRPLNIAHRGSPGTFPENTLAGFQNAVDVGADFMECDLVLTKDLQAVCQHDLWLSGVTDVDTRPEFSDRRRTYDVPLVGNVSDWFVIDFTLEEVKTLRTRQRLDFRDPTKDGQHPIPSLQELITVAQGSEGRVVGIYPELKHPQWHNWLAILGGDRMEDIILAMLAEAGYSESDDPCIIQSFSEESILYVSSVSSLRTSILINNDSWQTKLPEWSQSVFAIGPSKTLIAHYYDNANGYKNWITGTSSLVEDAHALGLQVHTYTFRSEDRYLAWDFKQDPLEEYKFFLDQGVDGVHTDFPETFDSYLDTRYPELEECVNAAPPFNRCPLLVITIMSFIITGYSWIN